MAHTQDQMRTFKATTSLAVGLTKERVKIQHDLLKISHGKYHQSNIPILINQTITKSKILCRQGPTGGAKEDEEDYRTNADS
jgi:hypothetical protein